MTFELYNVCNLECIMCSGNYSHLIRKNREKLPTLPFVYDEKFLSELDEFLPQLKFVEFAGGEPTLIKYYYKIWERLLTVNRNCRIHVQTNGTIITEEFKSALKSGQFNIGLSIDSQNAEDFEKIRLNAKYIEVVENIKYYEQLATHGTIELSYTFCPMISNWKELPSFLKSSEKKEDPSSFIICLQTI